MEAVLIIGRMRLITKARESDSRPKRRLLEIPVKLQKMFANKLIQDWSPERISGWLKIQYPHDESMRVSYGCFDILKSQPGTNQWEACDCFMPPKCTSFAISFSPIFSA